MYHGKYSMCFFPALRTFVQQKKNKIEDKKKAKRVMQLRQDGGQPAAAKVKKPTRLANPGEGIKAVL
jgi:hypothetical protein